MSLFIGTLAFTTHEALNEVRLGVIVGSIASAVVGLAVLAASTRGAREPQGRAAPAE